MPDEYPALIHFTVVPQKTFVTFVNLILDWTWWGLKCALRPTTAIKYADWGVGIVYRYDYGTAISTRRTIVPSRPNCRPTGPFIWCGPTGAFINT